MNIELLSDFVGRLILCWRPQAAPSRLYFKVFLYLFNWRNEIFNNFTCVLRGYKHSCSHIVRTQTTNQSACVRCNLRAAVCAAVNAAASAAACAAASAAACAAGCAAACAVACATACAAAFAAARKFQRAGRIVHHLCTRNR